MHKEMRLKKLDSNILQFTLTLNNINWILAIVGEESLCVISKPTEIVIYALIAVMSGLSAIVLILVVRKLCCKKRPVVKPSTSIHLKEMKSVGTIHKLLEAATQNTKSSQIEATGGGAKMTKVSNRRDSIKK